MSKTSILTAPKIRAICESPWSASSASPQPVAPRRASEPSRLSLENFGLPQPRLVYQEKKEGFSSWEECGSAGVEMDFNTVMFPLVTGEQLEAIYINMDSHVLKSHKGRIKSITEDQIKLADKK